MLINTKMPFLFPCKNGTINTLSYHFANNLLLQGKKEVRFSVSVFSEKLQEYITKANIKIASLSKLSGVERSFIQKMLTGERIPGDPAVLQQLAEALMLTPTQRRVLTEAYSISKMGEVVYYRRLLVKRLIEQAGSFLSPSPMLREVFSAPGFERALVLSLSGKASIADTLRLLMEEELSNDLPHVQAVLQPECETAGVLLQYARICPRLSIEHIVCFDSELQYQKENKYNLQCLQKVFAFLFGACRYSPFFYYESISSKIEKTALFPWMILGKNWALVISQNEEKAVLISDAQTISLYKDLFSEVREECLLVLRHSFDYFDSENWLSMHQETSYSFQFEPCLGFFFTMDMAHKQIQKDLPHKEKLLDFLAKRYRQVTLLEGHRKNISFFTQEGLERFLQTGCTSELPKECYAPLPKAFRVELLRRMLACIQNGSFTPYFIQTAKFHISENLSFLASSAQEVFCTYKHPIHGTATMQLCEKSIAYSFCDFFEYLKETGLVLSKEKTEELLRERLKKAFEL